MLNQAVGEKSEIKMFTMRYFKLLACVIDTQRQLPFKLINLLPQANGDHSVHCLK